MVQIMRMITEHLPPRIETHLCYFTAYPLDETASTASSDSDDADRVAIVRTFDKCYVVISGSRARIQKCFAEAEYGLGYYCSNQPLFRAT